MSGFDNTSGANVGTSISPGELQNTAVTPGSYTYAGFTVDADGRLTAAANGTAPYVPGGTDVAVADGGTGASSAADARTNLGGLVTLTGAEAPTNKAFDATSTYKGGAGSGTLVPCGILDRSITSVATGADTTETDLYSYTLPANTLSVNGYMLHIRAYGGVAANANVKTIRVYFGATAVTVNIVTAAPNGTSWDAEFTVMRTGAATELRTIRPFFGTSVENIRSSTALAIDTTAPIVIKWTGQNGTASSGDITLIGGYVMLCQ